LDSPDQVKITAQQYARQAKQNDFIASVVITNDARKKLGKTAESISELIQNAHLPK